MIQDCGLGLDFYETIKLVNYIRSEVAAGNSQPQILSKEDFQDDKYLKPVIEDDALLVGLDDVIGEEESDRAGLQNGSHKDNAHGSNTNPLARVAQLEEELKRLQSQFQDYRETVSRTLDDRWNDRDNQPASGPSGAGPSTTAANATPGAASARDDDSHYFTSYSYNGPSQAQNPLLSYPKHQLTTYL